MPDAPSGPCPCSSGEAYPACCGRWHAGEPAPTAEALMRSRYTAFVLRDASYLLTTWDPATRPDDLELDDDVRWLRLLVLGTTGGGPFDDEGTVAFEAHHRRGGERAVLREDSEFRRARDPRHGRVWRYVGPR
ncbi:YchJ family protein [Kineococcus terrestris]|uniref:YchJ family protein n=1 Tax=Kineococcus terrestris TaxID=2044856 RepID=UPI0034DB3F61